MKILHISGRKKWLLLLPVILLICLIILIKISDNVIHQIMLQEKYVSVCDTVNTYGRAANVTNAKTIDAFELHTLREAVESLDRLPYIYGALYRIDEYGELERISGRYAENPAHAAFDVHNYAAFVKMANEKQNGHITLRVTDSPLGEHDALIYYRWAPVTLPAQDRYLIVGGVTQFSVVTAIPAVINLSLWAAAFATAGVVFYTLYVTLRKEQSWTQDNLTQ